MKKCNKCLKTKDFSEFYDKDTSCKKCRTALKRFKYRKIEEKERSRNTSLKYSYNLTILDYNNLFNYQNGCCAICKRHQSEFKKRLAVDHNHITGKIRGLLCYKCNTALGLLKSDETIVNLENALMYIKESNKIK